MKKNDSKKTVITYGTFDVLHHGHYNLLKRAKELGDKLIVGVTSDSYDFRRGKLNVKQSLSERIENVRKTGLADLIIVEEYEGQKVEDIQKFGVDIFAIGSDWQGKFDYLNKLCHVEYLERTKGISSTQLRNSSHGILKLGIIGPGNIAKRFTKEANFVSGLSVEAVYGLKEESVSEFASQNNIYLATTDFDEFIDQIDAVYIATPHHTHYEYSKLALQRGKHVLCEKPITLQSEELKTLFELADNNNVVLLEAIKTAFAPAFIRLISVLKTYIIGDIIDIQASFTKIIENEKSREFSEQSGGSVTELASYTLLPVVKLMDVDECQVSYRDILKNGIDIYTKIDMQSSDTLATSTTGIQAKREGDLVVAGTKGYIYVPAPWWLTNYFEIRDKDGKLVQQISDQFIGDGLRYEIAEFLSMINSKKKESHKLRRNEMLQIVSLIEKYLEYRTQHV